MIIERQKSFSIQTGGPDKGGSLKRELAAKAKMGAVAGGLMGGLSGIIPAIEIAGEGNTGDAAKVYGIVVTAGAIIGSIASAFTALGANWRRAKVEGLTMNELLDYLYNIDEGNKGFRIGTTDINVSRYIVEDQDPRNYMVNFAYEDGRLIINLNKPTNKVIDDLNESLERVIQYNRKADYTAESINNGFMVYVIAPDISEAVGIIYNVIAENRIKVNALTEKSFKKLRK